MELVNGYPCFNCTDTELAKKGINPAKPETDPNSPNYNPNAAGAKPAGFGNSAVTFGGSLAALNDAQSPRGEGSGAGGSQQSPQVQQLQRPGATLDISV